MPDGSAGHDRSKRDAADTLPTHLTKFIGRGRELVEIERLVRERRLVTLTGVGGAGKTRLASQLGGRLLPEWPDGVWLIDLGSVSDPRQIARLVAATLGVLVEPEGDALRALAAQLVSRRLLLCLDTCEHVLEGAAGLAEALLRSCPDVSVLATSREPLGVDGETVWRVPPLRRDEAVALFVDRAGLVAPDVDLAAASDDVVTVCERVDDIPLAIELAAAWVRAMTPAQIAAGLDDALRLLVGGRRIVPRHQTLLASIGWSHALLAEEDKVLFRRLAVFAGRFTLEAAERICLDPPASPSSQPDGAIASGALHMVGRLLDKSLVTASERDGEIRYRLLDTIRQYAEEQLVAAGEAEAWRDRHLDYFLRLAAEAEPGLDRDQDVWREILEGHRDNINAALTWGLNPPVERSGRGRELAAAMARQWFIRGQSADGLEFLTRAIDLQPDDRSRVQGRLLVGIAMLAMVSGRLGTIAQAAEDALAIAVELDDPVIRARALTMACYPQFFVDFERCQATAAQARAAGAQAGDPFARDWAAVMEGYSLQTRNRHDEAVAMGRLAFEGSWPRRDRFCAAFGRGVEIFVAMVTGDVRRAVEIGHQVVDIAGPLGDYFAVGTNTVNAAQAVGAAGEIAQARAMVDPVVRSLAGAPEADVVGFMVPQGLLHLWAGELDAAVGWFQRGVRGGDDLSRDWTAARCLPGLIGALRRLGRRDEASAWAERAVMVETGFGAPYELTWVMDERARLLAPTDAPAARSQHLDALVIRLQYGLRSGYADSLDALAELAADAGDRQDAVMLLATSEAGRRAMGYPRPPIDRPHYETLLASLRAAMGEEAFAAAWREGEIRPLDDVVAALTRGRGPRHRPGTGWDSLTPTELDVVRLIRQGLSNPEIAARLYVSRSTVKAHLAHIYAKVGATNRTELASAAARERPDE